MTRFRFRLRTLLAAMMAVTAAFALTLSWWTRPYAVTGSFPNGQRAWEQWERLTPTFGIQHVATIRWYPDGALAFEHRVSPNGSRTTCYAPNGDIIDDPNEWADQYGSLFDVAQDPYFERPYQRFIWWWNGW